MMDSTRSEIHAETPDSIASPRGVETSHLAARSCLSCHRRKIRCDRRLPCSNCVRGSVLCRFPGPDRPPRKRPAITIKHVDARLTRLEQKINRLNVKDDKKLFHEMQLDKAESADDQDSASEVTTSSPGGDTEERLMDDGESSRYVNDFLLSRVLDEERELHTTVEVPATNETIEEPSAHFGPILSNFCAPQPSSPNLNPSARQATQLWRAFVSNVNPVTKVIHIPTMEAIFFAALENPPKEYDRIALLFAIYLSATDSLEAYEVMNILGQTKGAALSTFKIGLEQSLAASGFLEVPSMESLQAVALYINCLRAYNAGRSVWTLLGLAIRAAQSIGLHRDGTNFKLSPFKTEMRRRLWWFLISKEVRSSEDHGINVQGLGTISDTKLPSNVEDSDLFPDMGEAPISRNRWTEMSFCLAIIETSKTLPGISMSDQSVWKPVTADQTIQDLETRLFSTYLGHCNMNIPIQRNIVILIRLMLAKVSFVVQQRHLGRGEVGSSATDESLTKACEILEMDIQLKTDTVLREFNYVLRGYTQYYALTYTLWHLCVKPLGLVTDRAWAAVEAQFQHSLESQRSSKRSKWTIMQVLRRKAVSKRDELMESNTMPDHAKYTDSMSIDPLFWDIRETNFVDWSSLIDNIEMFEH